MCYVYAVASAGSMKTAVQLRWGNFIYVDYPDCAIMDVQLYGRSVSDAGKVKVFADVD